MPGRNLYLLHFNGRHDNLGDQFIFRALVHALTDLGAVHIRKGVPAFVASSPSTSGELSLGWRSALTTLRGGAVYNFFPPGGRTWTTPVVSAKNAVPASLTRLKRIGLDVVGGRHVAIGVSVIPAANHAWCQICDWIGVRDHESLAALRAAGLARVEYFPDLSFLPESPPQTDLPRRGLRVSFRKAIPEAPDKEAYESRLAQAFGALMSGLTGDARRDVRAFHQVEEDEAFTQPLSATHDIPFEPTRVSLESFEKFYASADIVVSNRLHCLLMGAYCGAVPVALTSREHTKVNALFATVGWESLILPIEDADELSPRFAAIQRDLPRLRHMVTTSFEQQRRLGLKMLEDRFGRSER